MSHFIPGSVQTTYDRIMEDGLPGSMSDANPTVKDTFIAEGADIGYGLVISRGSVEEVLGGSRTGRLGTSGQLAATAGTARGTGIVEQDIAVWNAISDGSFQIGINGVNTNITDVDTSAAADLTAVAVLIEAELQAVASGGFTAATCTYDTIARQFTITSGTTGAASSVSDVSPHSSASGTDLSVIVGMDTAFNVSGDAATGLIILGITYRNVVNESASLTDSGTVTTKEHQIGVVQREGTIKVLAREATTDNGDVYFDNATGEIYANAAGGRTQLGSSKFQGAVASGKIVSVDIVGVR